VEGEIDRFRRRHLVPVPNIATLAELAELVAAGDAADDDRVITGRTSTVGAAFADEKSTLMALPAEAFDPRVVESRRVDQRARVSIRQCHYSVPARYAGRRLTVRLGASMVEVLDGDKVVATHTTSDTAAQAAINAAARELHLPTVRAEAERMAEIAVREHQTHRGYLAEVLAAEVADRTERRRVRRINEAKFPRIKRLAEFNIDAVPSIKPATWRTWPPGTTSTPANPWSCSATPALGRPTCSSDSGWPPANKAAGSATSPPPAWSTNSSKPPTNATCPRGRPLRAARPALPGRTRLRPDRPRGAELLFQIIAEREERASIAIATNLPFSEWGAVFPDPGSSPRSSIGSPSTPTSSRPAPSPTGYAPARTPAARPADPLTPGQVGQIHDGRWGQRS
jgi:hypothetical protein